MVKSPFELPDSVEKLIPQREPMLLVSRLLARNKDADYSLVEAVIPESGIFIDKENTVAPEFYIELIAQAMAATNGYDMIVEGKDSAIGYLVGIDSFSWHQPARPGRLVHINIKKNFEFGPVTLIEGIVKDAVSGAEICAGALRTWEEGK